MVSTNSRRTTWIVVAVVVALAAIALVSTLGNLNLTDATETFSGISVIELDLENSPVVVRADDVDEVRVQKRFTTGWFGGSDLAEQDGDQLRLVQRCPGFFGFGCRARYEVTVPADVELTGETSNGSLTIEALEGQVDVATSNGAIQLDRVSGEVRAGTSNGAITGTGLRSNQVDLSTSNGRVELTFDEAPRAVNVHTSNGRVEVVLPDDSPPYALSTSTSNGNVATAIRTDPAAADNLIDVSTSNGDITVRYP
jgi:hypothetical protein